MGRPTKANLPIELQKVLKTIGANVQAARRAKEISQSELARRSKVSLTTINEIETRRFRDIRISTLSALAKVLDVPVGRFFEQSSMKLSNRDSKRFLKASDVIAELAEKLKD